MLICAGPVSHLVDVNNNNNNRYYECSAKKLIGLEEVFKAATEVIEKHNGAKAGSVAISDPKTSAGCCLLQ